MAESVGFSVNGEGCEVVGPGERSLLEVLREELGLTGTKYGCGEGSCRSCVVLVNGRPVASCQTEVGSVEGKEVRTIEGLADVDALHPIQEAFVAESAMQCGYCVPGMILTVEALLRTNPDPSRDEIVEWMNGNLCRCTNYVNILNAVERAARAMRGETVS